MIFISYEVTFIIFRNDWLVLPTVLGGCMILTGLMYTTELAMLMANVEVAAPLGL